MDLMNSVRSQFEKLISLFSLSIDISKRKISEGFNQCEISQPFNHLLLPDKDEFKFVISSIDSNDIFIIILKWGYENEIRFNIRGDEDQFDKFYSELIYEYEHIKDISVTLDLFINKNQNEIRIYYPEVFFNFKLSSYDLEKFLNYLKTSREHRSYFSKKDFILESGFFHGQDRNILEHKRVENVNFLNASEFPYYVEDFIISDSIDELFTSFFKKLAIVFCIVSICDTSHIKGNCVTYKIKGYKSFSGSILWDDIQIEEYSEWLRLYEWIYLEGIASDKIGITRNIISLYCSNKICISAEIFDSIQSGFILYLKENLEKYVEIRNKITDTLFNISIELSKKVDAIVDNMKVFFMIFISFYFAAFVMNAVTSAALKELFNPKMTALTLVLQFLSLPYLLFLNVNIVLSRRYYDHLIENFKREYEGILDTNDIENIFSKSFSYEYLKNNNRHKQIWFSILWIITFTIFSYSIVHLCDVAFKELPIINKISTFFTSLFS